MNKELLELDKAFRGVESAVLSLKSGLVSLEAMDKVKELEQAQISAELHTAKLRITELEAHLAAESANYADAVAGRMEAERSATQMRCAVEVMYAALDEISTSADIVQAAGRESTNEELNALIESVEMSIDVLKKYKPIISN